MESPKVELNIYDFYDDIQENKRIITSFVEDNIINSNLCDNLFLLKFMDLEEISSVIHKKFGMDLVWLDEDPTPGSFKEIAKKYSVLINLGEINEVFIPLNISIDIPKFELELPKFNFHYKFILASNMTSIKLNLNPDILSLSLFEFNPLLVLRRLLLDCMELTGTDLHFVSIYNNKKPLHKIQYRIQRELYDSDFNIDGILMQRIINKVISLKSTTSPVDLDSTSGITTDVSNIFNDETVDLRITGSRVSAGFYIVMAIQQITTTSKDIDQLGFFKRDLEKLKYLAKKNEGLILHTGKMRSGKNTTIFAMVNHKIKDPIRIIEYSNPIEVRMPFPQVNYKGDIPALKNLMRLAKKEDIDYAIVTELPDSSVAFAVHDLVNSAIGVMTTTHLNRVYHLPYKLQEIYGDDYKSIISQLTAVVNHRMLRKQISSNFIKCTLDANEKDPFKKFAYNLGVRNYYEPKDYEDFQLLLQPIVEILILNEDLKTELLNHKTLYESEQSIKEYVIREQETFEYKIVNGINEGIFNLAELNQFY